MFGLPEWEHGLWSVSGRTEYLWDDEFWQRSEPGFRGLVCHVAGCKEVSAFFEDARVDANWLVRAGRSGFSWPVPDLWYSIRAELTVSSGGVYIYYWPRNSQNVPDDVRVGLSSHLSDHSLITVQHCYYHECRKLGTARRQLVRSIL